MEDLRKQKKDREREVNWEKKSLAGMNKQEGGR